MGYRRLVIVAACTVLILVLAISHVNAQLSYEVTVTCQGLPGGQGAGVYVDGAPNGTVSSGQIRYFTFSSTGLTHTISVDQYVPTSNGANGTRYYDNNPSWAFSGPGNHTFAYSAQFYLSLQTAYSSISGEGWYNSGSTVQPVLQSGEVDEQQGIRLLFTGWSGDASGTNLTSAPIVMDGPKNASAIWKTQFLLTVQSDPSNVTGLNGSGWYDNGSSADFNAPATTTPTSNSRLRFGSWSGDYVGQLPAGTVVMDRPKIVTANFIAQYSLDIEYDPPSVVASYNSTDAGWYDAESYVQIGPAPSYVDVSSVERLSLVGWTNNGQSTSNASITIFMDGPHKIVLSYMTQYYVDVESIYGSTSGSGWYNRGSSAQISVSGAETWPIPHLLNGWEVNPPTSSLTKTDDSWSLVVDQPYVLQAQWSIDYLPLMLVGGAGTAIIVVFAGLVVAYRRKRNRVESRQISVGARVCPGCGSNLAEGATFCQRCGAPPQTSPPTPMPSVAVPTLEDRVYEYIANHEGVISLSKAAEELSITVEQLKEVTDKLKREGRLT